MLEGTRLSPRLQKDAFLEVQNGRIEHNDIIGKPVSAPFYLENAKRRVVKIEQPTLDQYISLSERLVTPIYATYSNSIVSLLDIHPIQCQQDTSPDASIEPAVSPKHKLEILEAGTGHGALTLHLAQAIAAANPPPLPLQIPRSIKPPGAKNHTSDSSRDSEAFSEAVQEKYRLTQEWDTWKANRGAVIHTVENVQANRHHAERIVREFRQGLYWPHIDWYHDDVASWVSKAMVERNDEAFLSYVCLDMPNAHEKLRDVHPAMKEGAKVVIFVPSVTQIVDCVRMIQQETLPFSLDQVVELGHGLSSGRKWDVRTVKPRKAKPGPPPTQPSATPGEQPQDEIEAEAVPASEDLSETTDEDINVEAGEDVTSTSTSTSTSSSLPLETFSQLPPFQESVVICRPQIGERTLGGVFIAVFRKTPPETAELEHRWKRSQTGVKRRFFR